MTSSILKLLGSVLSIWESKEIRKYTDKYLELKDDYEKALRADPIDNGVLDDLEDSIRTLSDIIATDIGRGK